MTHHTHKPLEGMTAAVMIGPNFEDSEATYPYFRLQEAGAEVTITGIEEGELSGKHGQPLEVERPASALDAGSLDVLVIAGGMGPDKLRMDDGVLALVRAMHEAGKPIAFICHAGWVPASAGIVDGRRVTSYPSIADDMRNAGAEWEDSEVVVDRNLVSSRNPGDLPAFMRELIGVAEGARQPLAAG
ncbi:MAG: type 1 glutamine amidotransferase domain-containing protein [Solirubrobacterales bacterium]